MDGSNTAGKTAKKFSGVMLALRIQDAKELKKMLTDDSYVNREVAAKISKRIEKQIAKREGEPESLQRLEEKERKAEERADTDMETAMDQEKEEQERYARENRVK